MTKQNSTKSTNKSTLVRRSPRLHKESNAKSRNELMKKTLPKDVFEVIRKELRKRGGKSQCVFSNVIEQVLKAQEPK
jgi:hypothetical protein